MQNYKSGTKNNKGNSTIPNKIQKSDYRFGCCTQNLNKTFVFISCGNI